MSTTFIYQLNIVDIGDGMGGYSPNSNANGSDANDAFHHLSFATLYTLTCARHFRLEVTRSNIGKTQYDRDISASHVTLWITRVCANDVERKSSRGAHKHIH